MKEQQIQKLINEYQEKADLYSKFTYNARREIRSLRLSGRDTVLDEIWLKECDAKFMAYVQFKHDLKSILES